MKLSGINIESNRKRNSKGNSTKKSGGQKGHKGTTLPLDDNSDITYGSVYSTLLPPSNFIAR